MFFRKKAQALPTSESLRIAELEQKLEERERQFAEFVQNVHHHLSEIFAQHEIVNSQHELLGNHVEKVKEMFDQFNFIEEKSATVSKLLHERGNHLYQETENMVNEATSGKENVDQLLKTIYSLGEEVKNNSDSMKDLEKSSNEIEEITNVINNIASQTNLLALNASIEAARAGEHGRGFAVVAEEVRKLAEITANSTNSIAELIKRIKQEIDNALAISIRTADMVKNSVQTGEEAMVRIEKISEYTNIVKNDVKNIVSFINEQQQSHMEVASSEELIHEIYKALNAHINEAAVIDEQLIKEINSLKKYL